MKANNNVVAKQDNSRAIYIQKFPYGYRLKDADKNLAGEWCCTPYTIEPNTYRTKRDAIARANEILNNK